MKRISFLIIIIVLFFIIVRLALSIYTLWHKQDLLVAAKNQLTQEKQQNTLLYKELAKTKSPEFLDEEARNKLLMVKPGESDVLIDQNLLNKNTSVQAKEVTKPHWQQWIDLFF